MVARTPQKQRKVVAPLNPVLLRETLSKVDKCMERLQELQYTIAGGNKVLSGMSLSPRSTRGYLKTSLRCKQESLRIKNAANRKSPVGKFPASSEGDWRKMSLPAMLLGETMGEILQASQFAREIVEAAAAPKKQTLEQDPKTPETLHRIHRPKAENTSDIKARRKKEKENNLQLIRSESGSPSLQRVRSRVMFKIISPMKMPDKDNRNSSQYIANRVSPKHKPWAKKTVLFPNPLFHSTESAQQAKFCRTGSPVIARTNMNNMNKSPVKMNNGRHTPHKFLIKSPVKIKSPNKVHTSPTRPANFSKNSSSTASRLRRSFSPGRLASRLVSLSPIKNNRKCVVKNDDELIGGLKQRPFFVPKRLSTGRI